MQAFVSMPDVHRWVENLNFSWKEIDTRGLSGQELLSAHLMNRERNTLVRSMAKTLRGSCFLHSNRESASSSVAKETCRLTKADTSHRRTAQAG